MSRFARLYVSAVLLCLFLASLTRAAQPQRTLHVPGDYASIQSALNQAASGDTVLVSAGTYYENLSVDGKELQLIAPDGPAKTILDGSHLGPVLRITNTPGARSSVVGFTVQNGSPLGSSSTTISFGPAGILLFNAGASISGNTFNKNTGVTLGVINASAVIVGNTISTASTGAAACSSNSPPVGIYVYGTSTILDPAGSPQPTVLSANTIFGDGTACSGIGLQALSLGQGISVQNNTIRNNLLGVQMDAGPALFLQNLIYDNVSGAMRIAGGTQHPSVDPAPTQIVNNTIVNNLTAPIASAAFQPVSDIYLAGSVARIAFINNVLIGTTSHPVLTCESAAPAASYSDTPLLFDHNDLYNTTGDPMAMAAGDCFPGLANALTTMGNLSTDPRLAGSTDLHALAGSPLIDAGNDAAPGALYLPFRSGAPDLQATVAAAVASELQTSFSSGPVTPVTLWLDAAGNARFLDGSGAGRDRIDIGAYEAPAQTSTGVVSAPTYTLVTASSYILAPGTVTLSAKTFARDGSAAPGPTTFLLDGAEQTGAVDQGAGLTTLTLSLPTPGLYTVTAVSSAGANGAGSSGSSPIYLRVSDPADRITSTLLISAAPGTQTLGQPIVLTIHLGSTTAAGDAGAVPPGAVTLSEGGTQLTVLQPDTTGVAQYTVAAPTLGTHVYTVSYAGTTAYSAATASTSANVTAPLPTRMQALINPSPAALSEPVTLRATVNAVTGDTSPTGSVIFFDGVSTLGSAPLVGGTATITTTSLTLGAHTITFSYQPDAGFSPSSAVVHVTVGGSKTATVLTASPSPASANQLITVTASVTDTEPSGTGAAPAGSLTISDGGTLLISSPYPTPAGPLVFTQRFGTPGIHALSATYTPATPAYLASSSTFDLTVGAAPSFAATLTVSPQSPVRRSQAVTFHLALAPADAVPAGSSYTLYDGPYVLRTGLIDPSGRISDFVVAPGALSLGSHSFYATINGPLLPSAITSNTVSEQIVRADSSISLTASPGPTTTATTPVLLTATVASSAPAAAGSVVFLDGGAVLGVASLNADGHATLSVATLSRGPHQISAMYQGSDDLSPSTSAAIAETVALNPTTTTLALPVRSAGAFTVVTLAAHVASSTTTVPIDTSQCQPACSAVAVSFVADTPAGRIALGSTTVPASGIAALSIDLPAGEYLVTAIFSGSPLFAGSSSVSSPLTITPAPSILRLTGSPNPVYQHQTVTLSAGVSAAGVPDSFVTGTVTFMEGSTTLGTVPLVSAGTFAYNPSEAGAHTVTAQFSGGPSLSGAMASVTINVLPSDFVLSIKDPSMTIRAEHHAPTTIQVATTGALSDVIDISCANLPQYAHCGFTPESFDLTHGNTAGGTLIIDTDALLNYADLGPGGKFFPPGRYREAVGRGSTFSAVLALCLPVLGFAGITKLRGRRRTQARGRGRLPDLTALLLLSIGLRMISGCSGLYPQHVAPGTYAVTIVGHARSSGITRSVDLTLVVTP